jgi:hypothetical protein
MTDRLGCLLLVTLEAARLDAELPVHGALRAWLDSWRGALADERHRLRVGADTVREVQGAARDALRRAGG